MIGKRLAIARKSSGLSMRALADKVGISANMIKKYEHDLSMPGSANLLKLSKALNVKSEYFFRQAEVSLDNIQYRKKEAASNKCLEQLKAEVIEQAERWEDLISIWPEFPIASFSKPQFLKNIKVKSLEDVEKVADQLREEWELGLNYIPDLVDLLESKGIYVFETDIGDPGILDGMMATVNDKPVIVVSSKVPGDRQRFTLSHELGHLLLEGKLPSDLCEEKACNRFASSFLLPKKTIVSHLGESRHSLEHQELYILKQEFGISMQSALYRANETSIIDEKTFKKIFKDFKSRGWLTKEPGEPFYEKSPKLFKLLIYRALAEEMITESKAAELLNVSTMTFRKDRNPENATAH